MLLFTLSNQRMLDLAFPIHPAEAFRDTATCSNHAHLAETTRDAQSFTQEFSKEVVLIFLTGNQVKLS